MKINAGYVVQNQNIEEKVNHEYNIFYLDMMRSSRENIFAKSREIEMKKRIAFAIKKYVGQMTGKEEIEKILMTKNIIDAVYRLSSEYDTLYEMNAEKFVEQWIMESV